MFHLYIEEYKTGSLIRTATVFISNNIPIERMSHLKDNRKRRGLKMTPQGVTNPSLLRPGGGWVGGLPMRGPLRVYLCVNVLRVSTDADKSCNFSRTLSNWSTKLQCKENQSVSPELSCTTIM